MKTDAILELRKEAEAYGEDKTVALCDQALAGDPDALREVDDLLTSQAEAAYERSVSKFYG